MADNDKHLIEEGAESLDFEVAKDLTVEEAVRKEAEIKAGITPEDTILDKYIKQNREQVESQKFAQQTQELPVVTADNLERFIQEQRQDLEESKLSESSQLDRDVVDEPVQEEKSDSEESLEVIPPAFDETIALGTDESSSEKKKIFWGVGTALLLITSLGLAYAWLRGNQSSDSAAIPQTEQTTETTTETTASEKDKENLEAFNQRYAAFFVDAEQTKLKNSEFTKLSELQTVLKTLEGSSYYDESKVKYDRLEKAIKAVEAVNAKFSEPAIRDGEKVSSTLKDGATLDDLSSDRLNTGNAKLDTLLQAVVAEGRAQLNGQSQTAASTTPETTQAALPQAETAPAVTQTPSQPVQEVSAATLFGLTQYDPNTLERHRSRVPYDFDKIADTSNPAWTFNEGILEKIVATSQQRGYITGNQYILEKVNIINGNGYYNMFKPDGTYLFSINCKTGYFVGNAAGHADDLDY